MKVLFIGESTQQKQQYEELSEDLGWVLIHYISPVKAMDNIGEIDPDLILFNSRDFPRHWKPFLTYLRDSRSKQDTVFILLKGPLFPLEEASKAAFLGANGIVDEEASRDSFDHILEITGRYKAEVRFRGPAGTAESELRGEEEPRIRPGVDPCRVALLLTHPGSGMLVTGSVEEIRPDRILFRPDADSRSQIFRKGQKIAGCSLRLGDRILTLHLKVLQSDTDEVLLLGVSSVKEMSRKDFAAYLASLC